MKQYRLGIVGLGLVGRRHAAAIAAEAGTVLSAVVDPAGTGQAAARELGVPCYEGLGALLNAGGVDGVILASPTPLHVPQARACVAAGLPTLIEKPIGLAAAEAETLVAEAEAASVPLLVGHHRRHNPLIRAAHEAIRAGRLGRIRAVHAVCWFYKPDAYFAEAPWRAQPGAGPLSVNLVHDIDLLRYLCGEIAAVQAIARPSLRGHANEDLAAALLEFRSGAVGTISVSDGAVSPWSWEMTSAEYPVYPVTDQSCYQIAGSDGALSLPDLRLWRHKDSPDWWSPIEDRRLTYAPADPLRAQIAHFAQVIAGRATPLVSGREGLRTLMAVEAIQRSAKTGARVRLPDAEISEISENILQEGETSPFSVEDGSTPS